MSPAKVTLSPKELELVNNDDWILTKNTVIAKVYTLFGQLSEVYTAVINEQLPSYFNTPAFLSPKIAKGEQYEGLPWVMLDQPRCFGDADTLSVRSFFWWGRFCSITLQLEGTSKKKYAPVLQQYFASTSNTGWHISVGDDKWKHDFSEDNYRPLQNGDHSLLNDRSFIKLSKKISLEDWDALPGFFEQNFREILGMLKSEI